MTLLATIINPSDLAKLNEHQLGILVSALDAEILRNADIKRLVSPKIQELHKSLAGGKAGASQKGGSKGGTAKEG